MAEDALPDTGRKPTVRHRVEHALLTGAISAIRLLGTRGASRLGGTLGKLGYAPLKIRRRVAEENLRAAFPEKDNAWIAKHQPDVVAVERVFAQHNVKTVMGTAQASAVAITAAARAGIPVAMHTPSEVKASITGNGRADKQQVGAMVTRLLKLEVRPSPADVADALALAICHVWRGGAEERLADARRKAALVVVQ